MLSLNDKNKQGFTLIELIITVAILAILSISALSFLSSSEKRVGQALDAKRWSSVSDLVTGLELYVLDNVAIPSDFNLTQVNFNEKWVLTTAAGANLTCGGVSKPRMVLDDGTFLGRYIGSLPQDEKSVSPNTGYYVTRLTNNIIAFGSCDNYNGTAIEKPAKAKFPTYAP